MTKTETTSDGSEMQPSFGFSENVFWDLRRRFPTGEDCHLISKPQTTNHTHPQCEVPFRIPLWQDLSINGIRRSWDMDGIKPWLKRCSVPAQTGISVLFLGFWLIGGVQEPVYVRNTIDVGRSLRDIQLAAFKALHYARRPMWPK